MPDRNRGARGWAVVAGLIVLGIGAWVLIPGPPADDEARLPSAPDSQPVVVAENAAEPGSEPLAGRRNTGRMSLERALLPKSIVLDLPDEMRGTGARTVRIVSVTGRVLDTTAAVIPGPGNGLELALDPEFLLVDRYMIQVDTVGGGPLPIRRYVLEVR